MEIKNYQPVNRDRIVAWDVITASYGSTERIARFAHKADAEKFAADHTKDLLLGLKTLKDRGDIDRDYARDMQYDRSAIVVPVHDIPVIPPGGTLSPDKFDADYGWHYNQPTDASQE